MLGDVIVFQAEDGMRDLVRSRGLGDVYKRQVACCMVFLTALRHGRRRGSVFLLSGMV